MSSNEARKEGGRRSTDFGRRSKCLGSWCGVLVVASVCVPLGLRLPRLIAACRFSFPIDCSVSCAYNSHMAFIWKTACVVGAFSVLLGATASASRRLGDVVPTVSNGGSQGKYNTLYHLDDICNVLQDDKLAPLITILPIGEEPLVISRMRTQGYKVKEAPGDVNIVGSRAAKVSSSHMTMAKLFTNKFRDTLTLAWRSCDENSQWLVYTAPMTTVPGHKYKTRSLTTVMAAKQYTNAYCKGQHSGVEALRQVSPIQQYLIRKTGDGRYFIDQKIHQKSKSVNFHGTFIKSRKAFSEGQNGVNGWSMGCQVIPGKRFHTEVLPLIYASLEKHGVSSPNTRCQATFPAPSADCSRCTTYTLLNPVDAKQKKTLSEAGLETVKNDCKTVKPSSTVSPIDAGLTGCKENSILVTKEFQQSAPTKLSSDFFIHSNNYVLSKVVRLKQSLLPSHSHWNTGTSQNAATSGSPLLMYQNQHETRARDIVSFLEARAIQSKKTNPTATACRKWETINRVGQDWVTFDCSKSKNNVETCVREEDDICWKGKDEKMRVRYMWAAFDGEPTNGYRTDCSGFVSAMWDVGKSYGGWDTTALGDDCISYVIKKEDLKPGDILLNRRGYCKDKVVTSESSKQHGGHVTLFTGWADAKKTRYNAYEESSSRGAIQRRVTYPYYSGNSPECYEPRRFYISCDNTGENAKVKPTKCAD